jgi:hypothetical protein
MHTCRNLDPEIDLDQVFGSQSKNLDPHGVRFGSHMVNFEC